MKKLESASKVKIQTFEKKPINGGTPAMEKIEIVISFDEWWRELKFAKEYSVLLLDIKSWKIVPKRSPTDTL